MAYNQAKEFREILREHCISYGEVCIRLGAQPGRRIVHVNTDVIQEVIKRNAGYQFVKAILRRCPADTVLDDIDGQVLFRVPSFGYTGEFGYLEAFAFVLISKEWEPVPDGQVIPKLDYKIDSKEIFDGQ